MKSITLCLCAIASTASPGLGLGGETFRLSPSDALPRERFGRAVAVEGGTLVATLNDPDAATGVRAYLFDAGTGAQLVGLVPSENDTSLGDVAISTDHVVLGAPGAAAAYVYDRATGQQMWRIETSGVPTDNFGEAVSVGNGVLLVGAWDADVQGPSSGAAYLFDATTGEQTSALIPDDGGPFHTFGRSVATDGVLALVGAPLGDTFGEYRGSVYVYDALTGELVRKLTASDGADVDRFGYSVALSGTTAVVGAPADDDAGNGSGSAYVFDLETGAELVKLLPSDGAPDAWFGRSVSISGDRVLVGALGISSMPAPGEAFLFEASTGRQLAKLRAQDRTSDDEFGRTVAISGTDAVVGASGTDVVGVDSGAVFVFDAARQLGAAFCDGSDGALAACPCANPGSPDTGCDVRQATGGVQLAVLAQETTPTNRATLVGTGFPPAQPSAVVIRGRALADPTAFGDGVLCTARPAARLAATLASGGASTHVVGHSGQVGSGAFFYQLYFRNTPAAYCDPAAAFNVSSGSALSW